MLEQEPGFFPFEVTIPAFQCLSLETEMFFFFFFNLSHCLLLTVVIVYEGKTNWCTYLILIDALPFQIILSALVPAGNK